MTIFNNRVTKSVVNTSTVPNPSPFRYPGGKSWLIPYIRQWLQSLPAPIRFVEPFAGGANVGLTVAIENLAERVTLIELDKDVGAVWEVILGDHSSDLVDCIVDFKISKFAVESLFKRRHRTVLSRAFSALVKNRVRRGGIMTEDASLLKLGENGNGIRSRWYPETLKRRIEIIAQHRDKIAFLRQDGIAYIRANAGDRNVAFFVDPPYMIAGQRLYRHSEVDHRELFAAAASVSGNLLLTYDNTPEARSLAQEFGFSTKQIKMRTTHHSVKVELLISRTFSWLDQSELVKKSNNT